MAVGAPARPAFANLVGGSWRPSASGERFEKRNPMRPSELVGEFPSSDAADVDAAVAAARDAFRAWSRMPAPQRGFILGKAAAVLEARAEQVAQDMTLEMGKPLREARLEAARGSQVLRYYAGEW